MKKQEKKINTPRESLKIIPLGGLGEVGANMMVYEYADQILVVDTGLMFPENDMLGIDYIIPDISYLMQRRNKVKGIVITHGHEDHTGAIRHVLEEINAPIYATPLTRGLMEVKLARNGMSSRAKLETVKAGDTRKIGPFTVDFFISSTCVTLFLMAWGWASILLPGWWCILVITSSTTPQWTTGRPITPSWLNSSSAVCWRCSPIPPMLNARAGHPQSV